MFSFTGIKLSCAWKTLALTCLCFVFRAWCFKKKLNDKVWKNNLRVSLSGLKLFLIINCVDWVDLFFDHGRPLVLPTVDLLLNLSVKTYFVLFVLCVCLVSQVQSSPAREKHWHSRAFLFFSFSSWCFMKKLNDKTWMNNLRMSLSGLKLFLIINCVDWVDLFFDHGRPLILPTLDLLLNLSVKTYFVLFVLCVCLVSQVQSSPAREKNWHSRAFFFFLFALDALRRS